MLDYFFDFMLMENLLGSCNRKLRKYNRSKKRDQHLRNRLLLINFRKAAKREIAALNEDEEIEFVEVPIPSQSSPQSLDAMAETNDGSDASPREVSSSCGVDEPSCQPMSHEPNALFHPPSSPTSGKRCSQGVWSEEDSMRADKRARFCV
ncbi:hypothetical protein K493DRAFT_313329 [Basidiobolus meristosporus CBS 931.73]|uniref:Uncharacterized protein n=1 Tax=Basidiobolus meristosporus CBS 931.73 TaxID=1314790 RepID=A0A1Y1YMV0_9FUNG|nr:hypothetical protein K493DRAFT_313329 [Basidiobolus meristosporus CBS 931.73]|eukprot:ORX99183.1 hypothetical protein K493DRAFT_313329 [Basidiobolus meristosporus CBS 931.73]